jgi:hypothetical protein
MPRPSAAHLAAIAHVPRERLEPPSSLDHTERAIWNRIVSAQPAGWFDGGVELLTRLIVLLAGIEALEGQLRRLRGRKTSVDEDYVELIAFHSQQAQRAERLMSALRLTPRSRSSTEASSLQLRKQQPSAVIQPWEIKADAAAEKTTIS